MYNIEIELFKIDKKVNSTKRPEVVCDSTAYRIINVEFLEPFDIQQPTLRLVNYDCGSAFENTDDIAQFNYCYIPDSNISRYYWITNWTREFGMWVAHCSLDVLATWRNEIIDTTQYVTRCSSEEHWNNKIIDETYKPIYDCLRGVIEPDGGLELDYRFDEDREDRIKNLCIAIGLKKLYSDYRTDGDDIIPINEVLPSKTGVYATYLSQAGVWQQLASVVSTDTGNSITSFVNKFYVLPFSLKWLDTQNVYIKYVEFPNQTNKTFDPETLLRVQTFEPKKIATYTFDISGIKSYIDYQNTSQFLRLSVKFMPFGTIEIPEDYYYDVDEIKLEVWSNIYGDAALYLVPVEDCSIIDSEYLLATESLALEIPLYGATDNDKYYSKQKTMRTWNAISEGVSAVGSVVTASALGGPAAGIGAGINAVGSIGSTITNAFAPYQLPNMETVSTPSGSGMIDPHPVIQYMRVSTTQRNDKRYGRPTCKNLKLARLTASEDGTGFVKCENSQFAPTIVNGKSPTLTEQLEVQNFLNGGCYLE